MKQTVLIFITLMLLGASTYAQDTSETYTLKVNLVNLGSSEGQVKVALCNKKENWLSDNVVAKEGSIDNQISTIEFKIPKTGEYAISTFHDENGNDEMDTNSLGKPKEAYAFSNGAKGFFGPASFQEAKFEVNGDMEIVIKF